MCSNPFCVLQLGFRTPAPVLDLRGLTQLTDLTLHTFNGSTFFVHFPPGICQLRMPRLAPASWLSLSRCCRLLQVLDCLVYDVPPASPHSFPLLQKLEIMVKTGGGAVSWAASLASRSRKAFLSIGRSVDDASALLQPSFHGLQLENLCFYGCSAAVWHNLVVRDFEAFKFSGTSLHISVDTLPSGMVTCGFQALCAKHVTVDLPSYPGLRSFYLIVSHDCELELNGRFKDSHNRNNGQRFVSWQGSQKRIRGS